MADKQKPCGKSFPFKTISNKSTIPIKKKSLHKFPTKGLSKKKKKKAL